MDPTLQWQGYSGLKHSAKSLLCMCPTVKGECDCNPLLWLGAKELSVLTNRLAAWSPRYPVSSMNSPAWGLPEPLLSISCGACWYLLFPHSPPNSATGERKGCFIHSTTIGGTLLPGLPFAISGSGIPLNLNERARERERACTCTHRIIFDMSLETVFLPGSLKMVFTIRDVDNTCHQLSEWCSGKFRSYIYYIL